MKKMLFVFMLVIIVALVAAPVLADVDMTGEVAGILDSIIKGLFGLLSLALATFGGILTRKLTKKWNLEQYNDEVDRVVGNAILYVEEWSLKKIKEKDFSIDGAKKFTKAYNKVAEKLPYLESETIKELIVSKLGEYRTMGLDYAEAKVKDLLPEIDPPLGPPIGS